MIMFVDLDMTLMGHFFSKKQKQPPKVFYKKDALKNFVKFTQKHLWQGL